MLEMMKKLMGVANGLFANDGNVDRNTSARPEYCERDAHRDNNRCCECESANNEGRRGDDCRRVECEKPDHKPRKSDAEDLVRLLIALKPYVNDDRCAKIESVIKILKLIQLSEKTGLLKSLL